jgi:large conductance mechanosensitive channel
MLKEFQAFLKRGNVMDLAVAVIIGAAFGAIVTSLVNDIIMPLIGIIIGKVEFTSLVWKVGEAQVKYGSFLQAIVNFLIIAFVIFLLVRTVNNMKKKEEPPAPAPVVPVVPQDVIILSEIRDLLKRERSLN